MLEVIALAVSFSVLMKSRFRSWFVRGLIEGKNCLRIGLCFLGVSSCGCFCFCGSLGWGWVVLSFWAVAGFFGWVYFVLFVSSF
jgi:hypothetical protein